MDAGDEDDSGDADREAGDAGRAQRLVRQEAQAEQDDEDRHRRLRDRRDARVDVGLTPRDERHRQGRVDDAEDQAGAPCASQLLDRPGPAHARREVRRQEEAGEEQPELGHRRRRDVLDRDLDEEVGGAPIAASDSSNGQ
jgi:hypothetical protein